MRIMSKRWAVIGLTGLLILSGVAQTVPEAPYAAPATDVVPFRLDRLPLDPDSIGELGRQLLVLAKNQGGAQPTDRRSVAQMLAVAQILTPDDPKAAAYGERYANGERTPAGDPEAVAAARARAWQTLGWLEAKNAGDDAHLLAACLSDIMIAADPKHPKAQELAANGEKGPWKDWVKPLDSFKKQDFVVRIEPPKIDPSETKDPPKQDDPDAADEPIKLAKATIQTVAWASPGPNLPRKLTLVPISMEAVMKPKKRDYDEESSDKEHHGGQDEPSGFSCRWDNPKAGDQSYEESNRFQSAAETMQDVVKEAGGRLPEGVRMTIRPGSQAIYRVAKDPVSLSAPLAVLMHSMSSGNPPQGTIIGEITKDGKFKSPPDFWQRLRVLSGKPNGRLVVPADSEQYLSAVLVMEDPGFFLDNEVVVASNLDQVLELVSGGADSKLADPSSKFAEIRTKRGNQAVSGYVANRFIRTRLEEIARATPCHASARLLAVQGAGQRPTRLTSQILATELLAIVAPAAPFATVSNEWEKLDLDQMQRISETGKTQSEALLRYAEMRDRNLVDQANDLMVGLRTFARAMRKKTDSDGRSISHQGDIQTFKELHERVTTALKLAAGGQP